MKIAVTAASGQLGGAIIRAALEILPSEDQVIGLARTPEKAGNLNVEIRPGDYQLYPQLKASLNDVDVLLLVSANGDPKNRPEQHRNVIRAAKDAGVGKMVYTSIMGPETGTQFSGVVQSNRETERNLQNSGLDWCIGRNGLYLEPDLEYIPKYRETGKIWNSAGAGKCAYTSRKELACAYARMMLEEKHNGHIYNLFGECISQQQLVNYINETHGLELTYEDMSVAAYRQDRTAELGEFMGTIIAGIYEGIRSGGFEEPSHYTTAAGRPHRPLPEIIRDHLTE